MADSTEASQNGLFSRLMKHLAKSEPKDIAEILGDALAKGESLKPNLAPEVKDLWTDNKATAVGDDLNIAVSGQAARGNDASPAAAHSDFAGQKGIEEVATRLGQMIHGMSGMAKALKEIQEGNQVRDAALMGIANHLAKAEDKKDDEKKDDDKKDKMEDKKEFGKSAIETLLAEIAPLVAVAKANGDKAAEFNAAGMAGSATATQLIADEATLKATKLFAAAKALDPTHPTVVELAKSLEGAKDAVKDAKEAGKKEDAAERRAEAEIGKGLTAEDREAVEKALSGQGMLSASVSKIMDILGGKTSVADIAKAMPKVEPGDGKTTLQSLHGIVIAKSAAGELDANEVAEANSLAAIFDGEQRGLIPKGIFEQKARLAPDNVRQLFAKVA